MNTLHFEVALDALSGFRADAVLGGCAFLAVTEARDFRRFRSALMDVARYASAQEDRRGILILDEPQLGVSGIEAEWASVQAIFRPELLQRLAMVIHRQGVPDQVIGLLSEAERESIPAIIAHVREQSSPRYRGTADVSYDILRILINQWFKSAGPLTSRWLGEAAGCSYPTVAAALKKFERYLIRHSDRRVELKMFPQIEWFRLWTNADIVRETLRFADHSGQPRSVESLISRLQTLHLEGVAIGGVVGARRRHPELDLVGSPRLDLTIHCRARHPDIGFVRLLDPALKPAVGEEPVRLAIHVVRYPYRFSETDADGTLWADPVECLLDLHEMKLAAQADDFLSFLILNQL